MIEREKQVECECVVCPERQGREEGATAEGATEEGATEEGGAAAWGITVVWVKAPKAEGG